MNKKINVTGTKEWASKTMNIISGCSHDCKYCYAKHMAIRFKRKTKDTWKIEDLNKMGTTKCKKYDGKIMFPSSHDLVPEKIDAWLPYLTNILSSGNEVIIVSKPHLECIEAICNHFKEYKDNILFRFTIGSSNDALLTYWEPNAPLYAERKEALKHAFMKGFKTSISCEPMLDSTDNMILLAEELLPYVTDSIWLGLPKQMRSRVKMNLGEIDSDMDRILKVQEEWMKEENIIKLYQHFKDNEKIKWKETAKKIIGIELPSDIGLDV